MELRVIRRNASVATYDTAYPRDFCRKVKALYPRSREIHDALERGSEKIERWLGNEVVEEITPEEILRCLRTGQLRQLRARARRLLRIRELYEEWEAIWAEWQKKAK